MSSRALRRAVQARELAALSQNPPPEEADSEDSGEDVSPPPQKQSVFALLGDDGSDLEEEEEGKEESEAEGEESERDKGPVIPKQPDPTTSNKKKKKKKKKKKNKAKLDPTPDSEDEIDAALRQLDLAQPIAAESGVRPEEDQKSLCEILKVDSRNFDAANEMRRLFGRAALDGSEDPAGPGGLARGGGPLGRGRGGGGGGGGGAPTGRRLTGRRNPFVQAKEEWPVAGSGGLGMEVVSSGLDGTTEFRFVHSLAYQDVQRQFMMCVASMDPNRLIQLLHHNPYHISTLLQASEIFAQQRDHTIAGDLLERALFTFGRSLHSTFTVSLASGCARLSFLRPENREFWLCCTRYLRNLQMRGTWRTASEFARLILALSPTKDPYGVRLTIDFVALKARQPTFLLRLITVFRDRYAALPNMSFSAALAHAQLGQPAAARESLSKAITKFPWIVPRLWSALSLEAELPPLLWGAQPPESDPLQPVLAELYIARTADLWKDPAATRLLIDAASTVYRLPKTAIVKPVDTVPADVARHVLVTDVPAVTALLPREWTRRESPAYDPLPPSGELRSYEMEVLLEGEARAAPGTAENVGRGALLREFFTSLLPHLDREAVPDENEVRRVLGEMGIDVADLGLEDDDEPDGGGVGRVRM